jgi:hypothetical protein
VSSSCLPEQMNRHCLVVNPPSSSIIVGKNNVMVQPKNNDSYLAGYLSLHQITNINPANSVPTTPSTLALKWTPNQVMNGHTIEDKSVSWQSALYIDLKTILFLHCHQVIYYLQYMQGLPKCFKVIVVNVYCKRDSRSSH